MHLQNFHYFLIIGSGIKVDSDLMKHFRSKPTKLIDLTLDCNNWNWGVNCRSINNIFQFHFSSVCVFQWKSVWINTIRLKLEFYYVRATSSFILNRLDSSACFLSLAEVCHEWTFWLQPHRVVKIILSIFLLENNKHEHWRPPTRWRSKPRF